MDGLHEKGSRPTTCKATVVMRGTNNNNNDIIRPSRACRNARHYKSSSVLNGGSNALLDNHGGSSSQALPRLANALRSLINSAGHSSKSAFVDAGDELIYYSNVVPTPKSPHNNGDEPGGQGNKKQRSPSLTRNPSADDDANDYFWHRQPTTLDQIRALYKSVPNFASLEEGGEEDHEGGGKEDGWDRRIRGNSNKLEGRVGRLCLALPPRSSALSPPPLQPQRKRLFAPPPSIAHRRQLSSASSAYHPAAAPPSFSASADSSSPRMPKLGATIVQSPPGSLGSCSLSSGSGGSSAASTKSEGAVAERGKKKKMEPKPKNDGGCQQKKMSSTDSGYRSRDEEATTPRRTTKAEAERMISPPEDLLVDLSFPLAALRPLPGPSSSIPPLPFPHPPPSNSNNIIHPPPPPPPPSSPPRNPRNFLWTQQPPGTPDHSAPPPISAQTVLSAIRRKRNLSKKGEETEAEGKKEEEKWESVAEGVAARMGELLADIGAELRRLAGVLSKCTRRDVGIAVLLLLPPPLAWHNLGHALRALDHFANDPKSARWRSMSARGRLEHVQAGLFHRWMLDWRIGAMVDQRVSLFLAAVFDSLLSRLLLHILDPISSPSGPSPAPSFTSLSRSLPHSRSCHLLLCPPPNSLRQFSALLRGLPLGQLVFGAVGDEWIPEVLFGSSFSTEFAMDAEAVLALHHFVNCSCRNDDRDRREPTTRNLEDWLRKATLYALHRRSRTVRHWDVLQAAHLILQPNFDCPPPTASELFADDGLWRHQFCPAAKSLLLGIDNDGHGPTAKQPALPIDPKKFPEFEGWTPLCWALALGETDIVERMLREQPSAVRMVRTDERHIQICASVGHLALAELLLRHGANPFKCPSSSSFHQSSSAFGIAVARGDRPMLDLFLRACSSGKGRPPQQNHRRGKSSDNDGSASHESTVSASPYSIRILRQMDPTRFAELSEAEKCAFAEGIYWAVETQRWELALELRAAGAPWPKVGAWMGALEWMVQNLEKEGDEGDNKKLEQLLDEFGPGMAEELIAHRDEERGGGDGGEGRVQRLIDTLFRLFIPPSTSVLAPLPSHPRSIQLASARVLSALFAHLQKGSLSQLERELDAYFPSSGCSGSSATSPAVPSQIDPKFVDCPDLSDIRFRFGDGQIVYAHRIVLVNASDQFRHILRSPSGMVSVSQCSAATFRLLLEFVYGNGAKCAAEMAKMDLEGRMELARAAQEFGMQKLAENAQKTIGAAINVANFSRVLAFAMDSDWCEALCEDCERFALCNLAQLMEGDEGFWRKAEDEGGVGGRERKQKRLLLEGMRAQLGMAMRESRI